MTQGKKVTDVYRGIDHNFFGVIQTVNYESNGIIAVPVNQPVAVVTTAPVAEITPAAVGAPGSSGVRFGARRYVVGSVPKSPPAWVSVGTRGVATGVSWRTTIGTGVAKGTKPPSGRFVRWSPAERWRTGGAA